MSVEGEKNMFQSGKLDKIFGIDELKETENSESSSDTFKLLEQLGVKEFYVEDKTKSNLMGESTPIVEEDAEIDQISTFEPNEISTELQSHPKKGLESPDMIYNELSELIIISKKLLKNAEYMLETNPDGESLSGAASLINAVRNVIKEFTNLYRDNIKYEKMKEIEKYKNDLKKELMEHKKNMSENGIGDKDVPMLEYSQEELVKQILKDQQLEKSQQPQLPEPQNLTNSPSSP